MKNFLNVLLCWLFGHDMFYGIVAVRPMYTGWMDPPEPDHGYADICIRCKEIRSEIIFESDQKFKENV